MLHRMLTRNRYELRTAADPTLSGSRAADADMRSSMHIPGSHMTLICSSSSSRLHARYISRCSHAHVRTPCLPAQASSSSSDRRTFSLEFESCKGPGAGRAREAQLDCGRAILVDVPPTRSHTSRTSEGEGQCHSRLAISTVCGLPLVQVSM